VGDHPSIEARFADYFANWGIRLPEGAVDQQEAGILRKAGWTIRYIFGSDARGSYLEFYASHRMTNDRRLRLYASGESQGLDAIQDMYGWKPEVPGDQEREKKRYREHNVRVAEELEALGLYPTGDINAYLRTHDVPPDSPAS